MHLSVFEHMNVSNPFTAEFLQSNLCQTASKDSPQRRSKGVKPSPGLAGFIIFTPSKKDDRPLQKSLHDVMVQNSDHSSLHAPWMLRLCIWQLLIRPLSEWPESKRWHTVSSSRLLLQTPDLWTFPIQDLQNQPDVKMTSIPVFSMDMARTCSSSIKGMPGLRLNWTNRLKNSPWQTDWINGKCSEHTTRRIQIDLVDMNNNMLMKIATDVCKLDQESRFTSPVTQS